MPGTLFRRATTNPRLLCVRRGRWIPILSEPMDPRLIYELGVDDYVHFFGSEGLTIRTMDSWILESLIRINGFLDP